MQLQDYQTQVQELVHDSAGVDFTPAELTAFINAGRDRVSLDTHCSRQFFQGGNLIPNQEQYPISGGIVGATMTAGGANYSNATTIAIQPPPMAPPGSPFSAVTATATPVIVSGSITEIVMTNWGTGYLSVPTITFNDSTGNGAAAVALAMLKVFDILSISIAWPGTTQRATLGWLPFTPFQAFCRANTLTRRYPSIWTNYDEINTFFLYPIPEQAYDADIDALVEPQPLSVPTDFDFNIRGPNSDAVQYYAAHKALLKMQNFEHAEYYHRKYKARVSEIKQTRQDRRVPNVYRNWFRRLNRW